MSCSTVRGEIPREFLRAPVNYPHDRGFYDPESGSRRFWKESWHVGKRLAFATTAKTTCDSCKTRLECHQLYSKGKRFLSTDQAAIPVSGSDVACLDCVYGEDYDRPHITKPPENDEENLIYKNKDLKTILSGEEVQSLPGFDNLTHDERINFVEASIGRSIDPEKDQELLKAKDDTTLTCQGWICVLTGSFDTPVSRLLVEQGAEIRPAVTNAITHCIVGQAAPGAFGGKSGPNSTKTKEAKKRKKCILNEQEFTAIVLDKTLTMNQLMEARRKEAEKQRQEAKEAAKKRKAAAMEAAKKELEEAGPRRSRRSQK